MDVLNSNFIQGCFDRLHADTIEKVKNPFLPTPSLTIVYTSGKAGSHLLDCQSVYDKDICTQKNFGAAPSTITGIILPSTETTEANVCMVIMWQNE